ncbi:MAG: DUF58 domain-containing protein [Proteobacteria bacterium]|nr:DUF58 domain-containing protein [Pseudomonadota bacterium]
MHLARRAYVLIVLTAVLAVVAIWSDATQLTPLWRLPAALLLAGLAMEALWARRATVHVAVRTAVRAVLGVPQAASFEFTNGTRRPLLLQYAPQTPHGVQPMRHVRQVRVVAGATVRDAVTLLPVHLGRYAWPQVAARLLGPLALAWWARTLQPQQELRVTPETLARGMKVHGTAGGARARRRSGAGAELRQLRAYQRGDPLVRIDWKATARRGALISRDYSEDQHLDIMVVIDAGRLSRVPCGPLDRLGVYCNLAARFAQVVTGQDDRIGLLVYAAQVLVCCPPARGVAAVAALRGALESLAPQQGESDVTAAAVRLRQVLRHRTLVVLLTDLDDAAAGEQLARAVRLLAPPHLVMVAGAGSGEVEALVRRHARDWRDPWISLAAAEQVARATSRRAMLERLGAPVVVAPAARLEQAVFERYEALRRLRRI